MSLHNEAVPLRPLVVACLSFLSLLASTREASAFCRTRTDPVSADDCAAKGPSLYWKNQCVGWAVNTSASKKANLAKARAIVASSFAAWTAKNGTCTPGVRAIELNPTATTTVGFDPNSGKNENVIVFRDAAWPYDDGGNPLALTTVTFNAQTGEILDADIEVNTADVNVTAAEPLPANGYDLQSIITHEVGHFLGLAHSRVNGATMEARYDKGETGLRTLEADDQQGLCAIYPSTTARTTDQTGATSPSEIKADQCDTTPTAPPPAYDDKGCAFVPGGTHTNVLAPVAIFIGVAASVLRRRRKER